MSSKGQKNEEDVESLGFTSDVLLDTVERNTCAQQKNKKYIGEMEDTIYCREKQKKSQRIIQ